MSRTRFWFAVGILGLALLVVPFAHSQPVLVKQKPAPKLEAVAETKLLMEGLADTNMRGLGKILKEKPKEAEAWNFARGQALLIGETGNLLMMRPPKTPNGQEAWMTNAVEMRDGGANLARSLAAKDYTKSRTALASLANVCNHCHQAFQVQSRINPFGDD
jgi:cytochrome c553